MIYKQSAVNFFIISALSSSWWGNRGKLGRAVSAQKHEHVRIYLSKEEEASSVLKDDRDSLDPDASNPLAGMHDGISVRKLPAKKGSKKNTPAPIPPVLNTSTKCDLLTCALAKKSCECEVFGGASCDEFLDSTTNQQEYYKALEEAATKVFSIAPSAGEGRAEGSFPTIVAEFPDGVFDMEKRCDFSHIRSIKKRCQDAVTSDTLTRAQYLGCHIYFDVTDQTPPMALGPIKLGTNIHEAMSEGKYHKGAFENFFNPDAMAVMIDQGCYSLDTSDNTQKEIRFSYVSESEYSRSLDKSNGVDVQTKVGYGPFSANAGYNKQTTESDARSGKSAIGYGQKKYFASVGTLKNKCMNSDVDFDFVIKKYKLIKQEIIDKWKMMQDATNYMDLAKTTEFQSLAKAGQQVPNVYVYGASAEYSITLNYQETSSTSSKDASSAITAGLSGGFAGATASVDTKISNSVKNASEENNLETTVDVTVTVTGARGGNLSTNCFNKDEGCADDVISARNEMQSDLSKLGGPSSHSVLIDIDELIKWQTGEGLGSVFSDALKYHYAYAQCTDNTHFNVFNGYGDSLNADSIPCGGQDICNKDLYEGVNLLSLKKKKRELIRNEMCIWADCGWTCFFGKIVVGPYLKTTTTP